MRELPSGQGMACPGRSWGGFLHDHGITLEELRQEHLDAWLADGPSTRRFVDRFIPWAIKCRLVDPALTIARHRRGTSPKLPKSEQDAAVERVVHTDELTVRDRAAAILVIVFGQHIEDVVQLTWDDVAMTHDVVTIRLGRTEFTLPSPLDEPMRQLAAAPVNDVTASHPTSNWVFRGYSPGQHITGARLRNRLTPVFSTRAARLGTLRAWTSTRLLHVLRDRPRSAMSALGVAEFQVGIQHHNRGLAVVVLEDQPAEFFV